eukprot:1946882-Rhodomonas_salina.1
MDLVIIPVSLELRAYVEFFPCLKWCKQWGIPYLCGLKWCNKKYWRIGKWSMSELRIPLLHIQPISQITSKTSKTLRLVAQQINDEYVFCTWYAFPDSADTPLQWYRLCATTSLGNTFCQDIEFATTAFLKLDGLERSGGTTHITVTMSAVGIEQASDKANVVWESLASELMEIAAKDYLDSETSYVGYQQSAPPELIRHPCVGSDLAHECVLIDSDLISVRFIVRDRAVLRVQAGIWPGNLNLTLAGERDVPMQDVLNVEQVLDIRQESSFVRSIASAFFEVLLPFDLAMRSGSTAQIVLRTHNVRGMSKWQLLPVLVDRSVPQFLAGVVQVDTDGPTGSPFFKADTLITKWGAAVDPESNIMQYAHCILGIPTSSRIPACRPTYALAQTDVRSAFAIGHAGVVRPVVTAENFAHTETEIGAGPVVGDFHRPECEDPSLIMENISTSGIDTLSGVRVGWTSSATVYPAVLWTCWDYPAGVWSTWMGIGSTRFAVDVVAYHKVEAAPESPGLFRLPVSLELQPGLNYFITMKSEDAAGWIKRAVSRALILDDSPPWCIPGGLRACGGASASGFHGKKLTACQMQWTPAVEQQSAVSKYELWLSVKKAGQTLSDRTSTTILSMGPSLEVTIPLKSELQHGDSYVVNLVAHNLLGATVHCTSELLLVDVESQIEYFLVSIHGVDDGIVVGETNVGTGLTASAYLHATLQHGRSYWAQVTAVNGAGLSTSVLTDTVTVDLSPPVIEAVFDMAHDFWQDAEVINTTSLQAFVGFAAFDSESGVASASWSASAGVAGTADVLDWRSVESGPAEIRLEHFNGWRIFLALEIVNGAGQRTRKYTDGFVVDLRPPRCVLQQCVFANQFYGRRVPQAGVETFSC